MRRSRIIALILILVALVILYQTKKQSSPSGDAEWTVYGTMGCGWTRKQLDYMKKNEKPYRFVDCDKEGCSGMEAFPTLVHTNGEKIIGYSEV
jgi:hypothetical protein